MTFLCFQMSAVYAELETRLTTGFGGKLGNLTMRRGSPPVPEQPNPAGKMLNMKCLEAFGWNGAGIQNLLKGARSFSQLHCAPGTEE